MASVAIISALVAASRLFSQVARWSQWKQSDRASPTSQVGGCEARRSCCEVDGQQYYARLVKNPAGKFALYQGNIKSANEWEAPGGEVPPVKEEAKAVKEVRPPAHHCRSLLT